jgi:hypothetical protein
MQQEDGKHRLKVDSKIGNGAFGVVYKGTWSLPPPRAPQSRFLAQYLTASTKLAYAWIRM